MSSFSHALARVFRMDAHPGWLFRCLVKARILPHGDKGELLVSVDAEDRIGVHDVFAQLRPRLVLDDGTEVPLAVVAHTQNSGFPVRAIARPAKPVPTDARGNPQVMSLRVSYGSETKDLENVMRQSA